MGWEVLEWRNELRGGEISGHVWEVFEGMGYLRGVLDFSGGLGGVH